MAKNNSENIVKDEKKKSFFGKLKEDKKYNAKVQLIGYGIFIFVLVIYLNISGMNSGDVSDNTVLGNSSSEENTYTENTNLLGSVDDNYSYDIVINFDKKSINTETQEEMLVEHGMHYMGKAYGNKLEIRKTVTEVTDYYYKVDNNYYSKVDNITSNVNEKVVYDVIDGEYIELDNILELLAKASLDHVTNYSSGKKESVYHLKVKDLIGEFNGDDVVEFNVIEENGILKITIDYSNLFKVMDESIDGCKLDVTITDIDAVEDFEVIVSVEDDNDNNTNENGKNVSE